MGEFPFTIRHFQADQGSAYISHRVAQLLEKLHINEFTKSHARRTNDNGLVESRNGYVVRKHFGYARILHSAKIVHQFNQTVLSPTPTNIGAACSRPTSSISAAKSSGATALPMSYPLRKTVILAQRRGTSQTWPQLQGPR